jgi:hypothetical protein
MKFKPGDIAWVRHWNDGWSGPDPEVQNDWYLAVWDGIEQIVTVIDYVEIEGYMKAQVIGSDGNIFITPEDYLVDENEAAILRRVNKYRNEKQDPDRRGS